MKQVKENSADKAYRLITESLTKHYKPGDYLFENILSREFGMSRTPISIALSRLVAEGLLKKQPKRGCYIPKISLKDAQDLFKIRRILEIEAIRLIISQQNTDIIPILQTNIDRATLAVRNDDFEAFYPLDLEFHHTIIVFSQNEYLYEAWRRIFIRCTIYTKYFSSSLRQNQFLKETLLQDHYEMLEAMKNNDVEELIKYMHIHFDRIVSYVVESTLVYDNI